VLAGAAVLVFGLLPTEHVHITSTADGRHSDVIHRHYESHHPIGTSTELSDNDDDVHWLDASFTAPQQPLHDARTRNPLRPAVGSRSALARWNRISRPACPLPPDLIRRARPSSVHRHSSEVLCAERRLALRWRFSWYPPALVRSQ
jgi:hypothetical protein